MKNKESLLAAFLLAAIAVGSIPLVFSSTLDLAVFTSNAYYVVTDDITIYGNLVYGGLPVQDWPVALEVQDPTGTPVATRTPQTNTTGTYTVTFRLALDSNLGTYTVYVSSGYKGETATNSTTFELMPRDIAVTNAKLSKTVIAQGYFINITITVENEGYPTETFNVTLDANTTSIETQTVTLASGESATLTFTWNTTGFAYGNYTMSAYAWPVPSETNTADNNMTGGSVFVTISGDVNGDGTVNILDAIQVSNSFLATPSSSNWNPNADINGDNAVNILDAIILANHFLEHYP